MRQLERFVERDVRGDNKRRLSTACCYGLERCQCYGISHICNSELFDQMNNPQLNFHKYQNINTTFKSSIVKAIFWQDVDDENYVYYSLLCLS